MFNQSCGLATRAGEHIRQGDVLLIRRAPGHVPPLHHLNELPRENGGVVLAHGEHTGHSHQLRGPTVALFRDGGGHEYLKVREAPDDLVHEEHTAHRISVGDFELAAQVEYDPIAMRVVAD